MGKKGKEKNTLNKAKHTKLVNRKKNKLKKEQEMRKERLKAILNKHSDQQKKEDTN
ncbi:hypothetical protein [Arenibacter latericius]|uniref:hypothetical protein n=1 Tax=Arenibacter latericius TaxID=86104 RepID=UPI000406872B|nr:hypothetical protein [Arenibacter latericius]MDX1364842.1 hypothetical protein [Arenibacter latericius]